MYYFIPTKKGIGAELWGTYDDLKSIYDMIGNFWSQDGFIEKEGFDNRDLIISGFVHEIRKAYEGSRLTSEHSHFTHDPVAHYGCKLSWVHLIFTMNAIRFNMRFFKSNKMDLGLMLQIEYWLEKSLYSFDTLGASALITYLNGGIEQGNPNLYQFMRSINADYFKLKGGKKAFRQLGELFERAVYGTDEYQSYNTFLTMESKRLNCEITDLELSDDDVDYEKLTW